MTTPLTRTAFVVLGLLRQSPESVWDLKRSLGLKLAAIWTESDGQLYPAVQRLLSAGLISADSPQPPRKRVKLSLTESGRQALTEWRRSAPLPDTPRDELALRIALLSERPDAHVFRQLDDELQRALTAAHVERSLLGTPNRHMLLVPAIAGNWLTRRWVILQQEARAAWCREAITHLREIAHPELNPLMQESAELPY